MGFSVASLLMKLRPGGKRQRGKWRPSWRYQKGPGRSFLFRLAKMGQDPIDDVLVVNTSDDSDRSAAAGADFNVDIEYSLESLGPGHSRMTLDRRDDVTIDRAQCTFASFCRSDQSAPAMVRREEQIITGQDADVAYGYGPARP
jgi:hypothetical protein